MLVLKMFFLGVSFLFGSIRRMIGYLHMKFILQMCFYHLNTTGQKKVLSNQKPIFTISTTQHMDSQLFSTSIKVNSIKNLDNMWINIA